MLSMAMIIISSQFVASIEKIFSFLFYIAKPCLFISEHSPDGAARIFP